MASIHRDKKSKYWYASFRGADKKWHFKSTKCADRTQAIEVAGRFEREASILSQFSDQESAVIAQETLIQVTRQAQQGTFDEHSAREFLDKLLALVGKPGLEVVTIRGEFEAWLETKKGSASKGTYDSYHFTVRAFLAYLGPKSSANLATLRPSDVDGFRKLQLKEGKAPATTLRTIKTLRAALNRSRRFGRILTNPAEAVEVDGVDSQGKQPFTIEQIQRLFAIVDEDWKGMILIGYYLGTRIGDAAHMKWSSVDFAASTITYRQQKSKRGSVAKPVTTVLMPELKNYLLARKSSRGTKEFIFHKLATQPVSGTSGLSLQFGEMIQQAGITNVAYEKKIVGKGRQVFPYGFHSFRHSAVAMMEHLGVPEEIRRLHVGHTSDAHARYSHREVESIRQALQKYPPINPSAEPSSPA